MLAIAAKLAALAPGIGFLGLALYQALNQQDLAAAGQSLVGAAGALGFTGLLSSIHTKLSQLTSHL